MSPTPTAPDMARWRALHDAMRRSSEQLHHTLSTLDPDDRSRTAALEKWFAGYADESRAHHRAEDEVVFPALARRVPTYEPFGETLTAEHHHLDEVLDGIGDGLADLSHGRTESFAHTVALSAELRETLAAHLEVEDEDVLPLIQRHFSCREFEALDAQLRATTGKDNS